VVALEAGLVSGFGTVESVKTITGPWKDYLQSLRTRDLPDDSNATPPKTTSLVAVESAAKEIGGWAGRIETVGLFCGL
jgi:hypothetical protein